MEVNTANTTRGMVPNTDFSASSPAAATNQTNTREAGRTQQASRPVTQNSAQQSQAPLTAESLRNGLTELQESISAEFFDKFVQEANAKLMPDNRKFAYDFHEATNRIVVKVVDRDTDEIIREIPPEQILRATEKMLELVGVLFDEKA